jgi:hypothetical protein
MATSGRNPSDVRRRIPDEKPARELVKGSAVDPLAAASARSEASHHVTQPRLPRTTAMLHRLINRIQGIRRAANRRRQKRLVSRYHATMDVLESRSLMATSGYSVSQILSTFSQGEAALSQLAQPIAETAFGLHIPMLQQSLADGLGIASLIQTPLNAALAVTSDVNQAISELKAVFQSVNLSTTPGSGNNLLQVTWQSGSVSEPADFSVGGATDFSYFDNGVQGQLQGSLSGKAESANVTLTLGVDVNPSTGALAFYVADSSGVTIQGIGVQGTAAGQLSIGSLANVAVSGSVSFSASATLGLTDARRGDSKLRISDFQSNPAGIVSGKINGSLSFTNVTLDASLLGSDDMCWSGHWGDTIVNNVISQTDSTLLAPGWETEKNVLVGELGKFAGSIPLLSDLQGALDKKLPLINKSVVELAGLGPIENLLDDLGSLLPGLTININAASIDKIMHGQQVDLLHFTAADSEPTRSITLLDIPLLQLGLPPIVSCNLDATLGVSYSYHYSVGFGLDTHGFFLDQGNSFSATISPNAGLQGTVNVLGIPLAGAAGSLNFNVTASADLFDPFGSSRYYLSDIEHGQPLAQTLLNDLDASLSESLSVQLKAWFLFWSGSWNWTLQSSTPFQITHEEWAPNATYELRPDHTLWQFQPSGPLEVDSGVLAYFSRSDGSLMVLKTNGDVVQEGQLWGQGIAHNVLAGAVDNQGNPVNLQGATQYGVDSAGNVFVLTSDGRLWRILDVGQPGAPVATVVRYGGGSFTIDHAGTVFALSQDGHLDRGVGLDTPGTGTWTGIQANVSQLQVDRADTGFVLENGTLLRGLNLDTTSYGTWTPIGVGIQSFEVDNADTVFKFAADGTLYRGLGLDQSGAGSWTVIGTDLQSFTVDTADTVFTFGTDGRVWSGLGLDQPGQGTWNVIGNGVKSFVVDYADTVFNLGFDGRVSRGLSVDQTGVGDNWWVIGYGMKSFAVDPEDAVFNIATNGVVWRGVNLDQRGGGNWIVPGNTEQDAQVAMDGTLYMLDQNGTLSRTRYLDGGSIGPTTILSGVKTFTLIGGGQALVYLDTGGNLYQLINGSRALIHPGVTSVKLGSDGSTVYYLAGDGSIWKENAGKEVSLSAAGLGSSPSSPGSNFNLSGVWFINGTQATQVIQNGTSLTFINEKGDVSSGYLAASNRVMASGWSLGGTIVNTPTGFEILWDNKSVWAQSRLAGGWTTGAGLPTAVIQDGNNLLFVSEAGAWSSGYYTGNNQVEATDWAITGNVVSGATGFQIQWTNGWVWNKKTVVIL